MTADTVHSNIVVVNPSGEYLIIAEVKLNDQPYSPGAINQLKSLMASMGCSIRLAIVDERILLLRDSLGKFSW